MQLTNKEKTLLEDNLNAEYLCIRKYEQYAAMASDSNLKQLFSSLAGKERQHAETLKNFLSMGGQSTQNMFESYTPPIGNHENIQNSLGITDAQLLNDALSTEKHVSGSYNNAVLESVSPQIRKQLQHIQQEEQDHAESLFNEMKNRGWYKLS